MKYSLRILLPKLRSFVRRDGLNATIAKGASSSFVVNATGMGLVLALQLFLARILGTEEYGKYIYALSWVNTLLFVAIWGWSTASIRFVSAYKAQEHWQLMKGFLKVRREAVLLSSFLVAGVLAVSIWYLSDKIGQDLALVFWAACLIIPINALLSINKSSLLGLQCVVRAQLPTEIVRPLTLGLSVSLMFIILGDRMTAFSTMVLNLVAAAVALCFAWRWMAQATPANIRRVSAEMKRGEWARTAVALMFFAGMGELMKRIDILMLGALVGTSEAGIYAIAGRMAALSSFGLLSANAIIAPVIVNLYSRGKIAELQQVLAFAAAGISVFAALIMLGLIVFGSFALRMFGEDFATGYSALIILLVAQSINAFAGPVGFLMTMTGHQKISLYILGICVVLNAILNAILIPLYGMEGAAIATTLTFTAWNLTMVWFSHSILGISPTVLSAYTLFRRRNLSLYE